LGPATKEFAIFESPLKPKALEKKMPKRLVQLFLREVFVHVRAQFLDINILRDGDDDEGEDVAVGLEKKARFMVVFGNRVCIKAVVRVEDVASADTIGSDLYMHHLGSASSEQDEGDSTNDGERDEEKVVAQKFDCDKRARDEDDGRIPVVGLFCIKMFKGFPLHKVHEL
jgi:hypothetical protein